MLKEERQSQILDLLKQNGKVLAVELAAQLGVSEDTIRRDLRDLADAGQMTRVHGGGLPRSPAGVSFSERLKQSPVAKAAIARAAVQHIHNGQVIILDGGTTNLQVAQALPIDLRASLITNSPVIASALADYPGIEVVLVGGRMLKDSLVTIGSAAVDAFNSIRADLCILGVCSLHPEVGISLVDLEETYVKRAMMAGSSRVMALASAEKLGTASPYLVGPISMLDILITESEVPDSAIVPYQAEGIHVERV